MFIIWGETNSEKKRGLVADRCGVCDEVAVLRVSDFYRKPHLYYIPLGSGTFVGTVMTCADCKGKSTGEKGAYEQYLTKKQAAAMSLAEVLTKTNPALADGLARRAALEKAAREGHAVDPDKPDPRVTLAYAQLSEMNAAAPRVHELLARLSVWGTLDEATRSRLTGECHALHAETKHARKTYFFVVQMTQRFKLDPDGFLALFAFLAIAGFGIAVTLTRFGESATIPGILSSLVVALLAAILLHRYVRRRMHRTFFRTVFLPEADRRDVEVADAVELLRTVKANDSILTAKLRGLRRALPLLEDVMNEDADEFDNTRLASR